MPTRTGYGAPQRPHRPQHKPRPEQPNPSPNRPHAAEPTRKALVTRESTIGLEFIGPQAPNGRQAETPATGEPEDSRNVVTYYLPGKNPKTASNNQLDYAFASRGFHESVTVRAMNSVEEWGASDHCRLLIEIAGE